MISRELDEWADDFVAFQARFAQLFGRKEPRAQAAKYLRALLAPVERKNSWQIAEAIGDSIPDAMQRLLYLNNWDADAARDVLQQFIIEAFGDAEGIGIVDETGFIKKGRKSVGVKRQYSGTAGKIENCQIGTFLSYASPGGHVLLDRRLYLPEEWCDDLPRREEAKVPPEATFQTKPEQAVAMLRHAWAQSVPMRWVAGDEVYGDSTVLRDVVAESGRCYVLAVRSNTPIWCIRPGVKGAPAATTVSMAVMAWAERRWQRLTVAEGEKGPLTYDWAYQRVVESREQRPGTEGWLVVRRSITKPEELAYYLSNAPTDTPLLKLAQVASTRYTIEQCFEEAKGETGLDGYEVRYWHSWHRHITLSMMAHAWLASIRRKEMEKKGGLSPSWPN